jgi:hypothetical protein
MFERKQFATSQCTTSVSFSQHHSPAGFHESRINKDKYIQLQQRPWYRSMNRPGMSKFLREVIVLLVTEGTSLNHNTMHKICGKWFTHSLTHTHETSRQFQFMWVNIVCIVLYILQVLIIYLNVLGLKTKFVTVPRAGKHCRNCYRGPSTLIVVVTRAIRSIWCHSSQTLRVGKLDAGCWPTSRVFSEKREHTVKQL